ncbi:MAG: CapA family protein [Deltaproteobacteria bacterium]|nr:CapA family protein [Deltaproteobacteria bacterium]
MRSALDRLAVALGPRLVDPLVALAERAGLELRYEPRVFGGEGPLDHAGLALRVGYMVKLLFGSRHPAPAVRAPRAAFTPSIHVPADGAPRARITFVGDVLSTPELGRASISGGLRALFAASDRVVLNLEGTAGSGSPRATFAPVTTPAGLAQLARFARDRDATRWTSDVSAPALAAALDGASVSVGLANNHAFDRGLDGLRESRAALATEGLTPFGYDDDGAPEDALVPVGPYRLGLVATTFGHNHAAARPAIASRFASVPYTIDRAAFAARALALRAAGAQVVVASLHWGYEHEHAPRPDMEACARTIIDAGYDAVVGHHPHTFQRVDITDRGGVIAYALGDFIGGDRTPWSRFGLGLHLDLGPRGIIGVTATPLAQTPSWAGRAKTMLLDEAPTSERRLFSRAHGGKAAYIMMRCSPSTSSRRRCATTARRGALCPGTRRCPRARAASCRRRAWPRSSRRPSRGSIPRAASRSRVC